MDGRTDGWMHGKPPEAGAFVITPGLVFVHHPFSHLLDCSRMATSFFFIPLWRVLHCIFSPRDPTMIPLSPPGLICSGIGLCKHCQMPTIYLVEEKVV